MSEKRVYVYKIRAFGDSPVAGQPAVRLDINDIFTEISALAANKEDATGRILICRDEVDSDPLFIHIFHNSKKSRLVKGIIGVVKSLGLPDEFDKETGEMSPLDIKKDLMEKTHFLIDTSNGYMIYQKSKSSPNTGLLAYYVQKKALKSVRSFAIDAHIRTDTIEKIQKASQEGKIRLFQLRIKRTALPRAGVLGTDVERALNSLANLPGVESIGITMGLEKYKRSGGFSVDDMLTRIKQFLGTQTSNDVLSDVETAEFKLDDEEINLLTQKFTMQVEIPASIAKRRNIDSEGILNAMEIEYNRRKQDL